MTVTKFRLRACLAALALMSVLTGTGQTDATFLHRAHLYSTDPAVLSKGEAQDTETLGYPFDASLTVRVRRIPNMDTVGVLINGNPVATIQLTNGKGKVKLQGLVGQDVPVINRGDVIDIVSPDGEILLEGVFN